MRTPRSFLAVLSCLTILVMVIAAVPARVVHAAPAELFISEYIEGSSNNKAIEIYNGTGAAVDLAAGNYQIWTYSNGSSTAASQLVLTGTLNSGDVHVLAHDSAVSNILTVADQTHNTNWFNGNDAVALVKNGTLIDVIGQIGVDPGSEWGSGLTSTADNTLRRKVTIEAGDPNGSDAFDPAVEWDGYATNTFDGLGSHSTGTPADTAPTVTLVSPANNAENVALDANISVTFSEDVNLAAGWFTLSCSLSGDHTAVLGGGPSAYTLDPDADFVTGDACTFTVLAASVTDVDVIEPPDAMAADFSVTFNTGSVCNEPYTLIHDIQGTGETSPRVGETVTTMGVVVGDYEGASPNLRGFYLQTADANVDADPLTSEGVFVFNANNNNVALGDAVRVTATVQETQGQTQLGSVTSVRVCSSGNTVTPALVVFPVATPTALEAYEGMLVTLPQTMYVTEHFQLGRFGQVVISADSRLIQPTNVVEPGAPAQQLQAENNLRKIILDDTLNNQNADPIVFGRGGLPLSASNTLRGGDIITGLTGVMTFTWSGSSASGNAYRIRPQSAVAPSFNFVAANPRPAAAPARMGNLRVANMNLLNYFNTFTGCTNGVSGAATDCRGAENATEFARQWPKTVAAIIGSQADIIGIGEIENDGYAADSAIATLVDQLNAATVAGTYAFVDADALTGEVNALGTDAIKVGFLYKPAVVTLVDAAALNTTSFVNGGDSAPRNRPALAAAFELNANDARLVVTTNHLKSKGSACDAPDAGDGQGNCNTVRVNAATELVTWLAADPTGSGDRDNLIVGDLNSYAMEDPIDVIRAAGYTNLIFAANGAYAYSYVFDGQWGYLDHALSNPSLSSQVLAVHDWHINADEPSVLDYNTNFKSAGQIASLYAPDWFRVSDHDAVLVDFNLINTVPVAEERDYGAYEGYPVTLVGYATDPRNLPLTYEWDLDNDGIFDITAPQVTFTPVDGLATLTIPMRVTNTNAESDTAIQTVVVYNVIPQVGKIIGLHNPVRVGVPVNVSTTFTDKGLLDTHTAVWEISGGDTFPGVVTEMNGSGKVTGTLTFDQPGTYLIYATVTDKDGGANSAYSTVTVYSSFTMQAKGKGSYWSEAGWYLSKPTKGGLATFDFNSRIVKQPNGRYSLAGYFYLQMRSAPMTFRSTKTVSLQVTSDGRQAFIFGEGSLNGKSGYEYILWVNDNGANDVLQISIYDAEDNPVYVMNTAASVSTGSIQIKK